MLHARLLCAASGGAIALAFVSVAAEAQQSLPTIDVASARRTATRATSGNSASNTAADPGPTSPASDQASAVRETRDPKTPGEGYVVTNSTTATKTDVPIKETPAAIIVVPRQVIQDQQDTQLKDVLENVSGVRSNNNDVEGYNFRIRGFQSLAIFRNGLSLGDTANTTFDTANIERVEVLKGPASILYGRIEPGGLINFVTKQPLDRERRVLQQQFGSYEHYRTEWDVTGPVKENPSLAYRFSGAYQNNRSFRQFQGGERLLVAPVVRYAPSAWTEFTIDTQYLGVRAQSDAGVPASGPFGPLLVTIPLYRSYQEPNDPRDGAENYNIGYTFRQNLEDNWKITSRFLYSESWLRKLNIVNGGVSNNYLSYNRFTNDQDLHASAYSTNINLEGKFDALGGKHDLLMGLDYLNSYYDYYLGLGRTIYPINLYAPIYGTVPQYGFWDALIGGRTKNHQSALTRQRGLYVQEQATWFDRLHLLLGARFDIASVVTGACRSRAGNFTATKDCAIVARLSALERADKGWTPRAGFVFDLSSEVSAYASYSRSFGVNNGLTTSGTALPAQRALQWEAGLKAQTPSGLSATLAFFQITKSNVPVQDFTVPGTVTLGGVQRSRGIELDVIGRLTDRLSLIANYAYIDAKVIADNPRNPLDPFNLNGRSGLLGNHLDNVPRHSGKIFATYDFGDNGLGLRLGGGVTASTRAWGDIWNTIIQPGWARIDAMSSYAALIEGRKLTAQLNLRNLNNVQYYEGADNFFQPGPVPPPPLIPAKPFTAIGTISMEF